MKKPVVLTLLLALSLVQARRPSPEPTRFVATSPCDGLPRTMLGIPAATDCEMIRWELALHRDPRHQQPTFYQLQYTYGLSQPSTTGFTSTQAKGQKEGKWVTQKDAKNREIYRLAESTPTEARLAFVKLNDQLLHLLDPQGKLMIGHGGWSYTLNRKK
ncbi:hypothetical protein GCM10027275_54310 [Rhabdobacter roseus]|uniref:Hemin uptake protein HemP n=1 Tax=Rhabdobacter roseus TaxID=1655419 RepID=A0A840TWY7_9BACT|nr:copper resistance protein NlpE N-terminal domain-containing protein [Rhabdobacter roseus]MBB5287445.1 hemin uptake protein HemP [Rhabdobacter roseus]